jgi:HK97 family phage portal protein
MSRLFNSIWRKTPPVQVEASGRLGTSINPFDKEAQIDTPIRPLLRVSAKEAAAVYTFCPQVYAVVNTRASMVSSLPLKVYWQKADGQLQELTRGPIFNLLNQPNPKITQTEFIRQIVSWYDLTGTAVVVAEEIQGVRYLFVLNSSYVFPIVDGKIGLDGIVYTKHDNKHIYYSQDQIVVHWARFNPMDDFFGMSPVQPLLEDVMARRSAMKQTRSHYAKGGISSGILKTPDNLDEDKLKQLKRDWNRRTEDSSRLIVIADGWDFEEIKGTEGNISADALSGLTRETVCNAYQVPVALLDPDKNSHPQEAEQFMWTSSLLPQAKELSEKFTQSLGASNGRTSIVIKLDSSRVPILQKFRIDAAKATTALITTGTMTLNEGRAELDLPEYSGTLKVDVENIDLAEYANSPMSLYSTLLQQASAVKLQQETLEAQATLNQAESGRDQSADGEPEMVDTTGRK